MGIHRSGLRPGGAGTFCSAHPICHVGEVDLRDRRCVEEQARDLALPDARGNRADRAGRETDRQRLRSEISWTVDLGADMGDTLLVVDQGATDNLDLTAGESGIDLDADGHVDVTYEGVAALEVLVSEGASRVKNIISAAGSAATGGPVTVRVTISSREGTPTDTITGGGGDDTLVGSSGNDRIVGGDGNDEPDGRWNIEQQPVMGR